ncbi:RNA polymerase sigma-70 factor (ECF subfamily) [Wenyingzhuangia heitensis]|uniref:RNA polymerase sigma-70 factor (ECF subfamily) n=1 Tax=Wenyingzhuangia heitensis TaxID=1487859 RepID=A0ABX0U516_9FLAO|nr:sigma-70 family RNA polymerase sigma factor [Wenyingzhuangia heitensis]NIJ43902.1 RNA polymerase sigma-70 factor (ECF subfamily) [Wenyingzhuangia heitensis]
MGFFVTLAYGFFTTFLKALNSKINHELQNNKSSKPSIDQNQLWLDFVKGDSNALGKLYDLYIDNLVGYGIKICGDKSYTMDCIHDLFVDLYKYQSKLSTTSDVQFYLYLALKRKINKKYKKKEVFLDPEAYQKVVYTKEYTKSNEESIIDREAYEEKILNLENAVSKLTKTQQKGISLRFKEEKSYEEIAQALQVSVASARTIVYRAIKALRESSLPIVLLLILSLL